LHDRQAGVVLGHVWRLWSVTLRAWLSQDHSRVLRGRLMFSVVALASLWQAEAFPPFILRFLVLCIFGMDGAGVQFRLRIYPTFLSL